MASSSTEAKSGSGIHGTTDIKVRISNLKDAPRILEQLVATRDLLGRVRELDIVDEGTEETAEAGTNDDGQPTEQPGTGSDAEDDDNDSVKSSGSKNSNPRAHLFDKDYVDKRMNKLCAPIISILNGIEAAGGSLEAFSWGHEDGWWDSNGTRPKEYWAALWKHARTLKKLDIGFYTHEVHKVRPAGVAFPSMRELRIDASTAHGNEGDAVEHLLKSCPSLETLDYEYPGCDLETCQIKGITWDYTFPKLRSLSVRGFENSPKKYIEFVTRCPTIEAFFDGLDAYDSDYDEKVSYPNEALPNMLQLCVPGGGYRSLDQWFSSINDRPLHHIRVESAHRWSQFKSITLGNVSSTLKCLEFGGGALDWRPVKPYEADSDDDEETIQKEKEEYDQREREREGYNYLPKAVKDLLPKLDGLRELGVSLDSNNISMSDGHGGWSGPPPMTFTDLVSPPTLPPPLYPPTY
jgi:hypothetical protein